MRRSQQIAAAVALSAAGKKVVAPLRPARASPTSSRASRRSGSSSPTTCSPRSTARASAVAERRLQPRWRSTAIGDVVRFTVAPRHARRSSIPIKTVAADTGPRRPVVGVFLEPALDIHLPIPVRIDAGNVGGPSAGLAFALEVMEELGRDVVHGHRIAATGEIFADGSVGPIGGIKQKTIGAREAGVDAFLVPAGENARDARKYADGLRIIPVENFPQALRALATLGPST